ncbi:thrombin inhibitor hemalin-like [Lineus longissimus]|uniref:thrombin inhibitor hemalin-like n=1 Tax=Lineus longissimus TaxID=88925 RepID=UPI00315D9D2B
MKFGSLFVVALSICYAVGERKPYCGLVIASGPCKTFSQRYAAVGGLCKRFTFSGCGGNLNNFRTLLECQEACGIFHPVCDAAIEPGHCKHGKATHKRFGNKNGACEEFLYSGCGGNGNNFKTMKECRDACHFHNPVCDEPIKPGPCKSGHHELYGFDTKADRCVKFIWGGCKNNHNIFSSKDDCEAACIRD